MSSSAEVKRNDDESNLIRLAIQLLLICADTERFNYVETGYVDSIEMIRFVLEIESEFGVEITAGDMELAEFKTIGGLVSMIDAKPKDAGRADD